MTSPHLRGAVSSATTSSTLFSAMLGLATAAATSSATCHLDTYKGKADAQRLHSPHNLHHTPERDTYWHID